MTLQRELDALGVDIVSSLEGMPAPAALLDASGVVRWQNAAGIALFGDQRGVRWATIAPEYLQRQRAAFARAAENGEAARSDGIVLVSADGARLEARTIRLALSTDSGFAGVLGIVSAATEEEAAAPLEHLTPRQHETLRLLAEGLSTEEVAAALGVTHETARNYIRRVLHALDAHSRLEAVVRGQALGLV
jgi:DNA-binding CsgD family transcriptional regulator